MDPRPALARVRRRGSPSNSPARHAAPTSSSSAPRRRPTPAPCARRHYLVSGAAPPDAALHRPRAPPPPPPRPRVDPRPTLACVRRRGSPSTSPARHAVSAAHLSRVPKLPRRRDLRLVPDAALPPPSKAAPQPRRPRHPDAALPPGPVRRPDL